MASLRSLLITVDPTTLLSGVGVGVTTKLAAHPASGYRVEYIGYSCGAGCNGGYTTNYGYYSYTNWAIPDSATEVIFEAWGGGGGGGSSCCCSKAGAPGNSAAYAVKRLIGSSVVPGCLYAISLGLGGNGQTGAQCGDPGGNTSVTGFGLSNFCANGGAGGCSCCFACCCCWYQSNTCCACYYGADSGARGNPGASWIICQENHCWNKQFIPYPGGLINSKGGWAPATQCENSGCGYCLFQSALTQVPWATGTMGEKAYLPGAGGPSGWTCGGGCCYGTWGTPGLVRISYK